MATKKKNGEQTKAVITVSQALAQYDPKEIEIIKDTVAKGATDLELSYFLAVAKMRGLNPLTRQIHLVKRKQGDKEVAVIQTGIDGFRLIAQRTGQYAPSPKPTHFEYDSKGFLLRATVFGVKIIGGQAFEYSATAKFSEYAQYFGNMLGTMWKKMPETMLEKCAEAKLLRRGFPEELSGIYTDDEMQQADNTGEPVVFHPAEEDKQDTRPVIKQAAEIGTGEQDTIGLDGQPTERPIEGDADNPYLNLLQICPDHNVSWGTNRYGKKFHKQDNSWCNLGTCQGVKDILKARCITAGFDNTEVNPLCKNLFGGTWSAITDEQKVELLLKLDKMAENPTLKEAAKLAISTTGGTTK